MATPDQLEARGPLQKPPREGEAPLRQDAGSPQTEQPGWIPPTSAFRNLQRHPLGTRGSVLRPPRR